FPFALGVDPQQFAAGRIERNDGTTRPGSQINDAVHHQRSCFKIRFRTWAETLRLESPGDLQLIEIGGGDLIEWRVMGVAEIATVGSPFSVSCAGLCKNHRRKETQRKNYFAVHGVGFQPTASGTFLKSEVVRYGRVK